MSRILIDARMVGPIPHGIARYVQSLARGLRSLRPLPYEPVFILAPESTWDAEEFETVRCSAPFLHASELWALPRLIKKTGASLYHSPSFSSLWRCPVPWIITVHDLNHLKYAGLIKQLYYRWLLKPFVKNAASVLSISEFSRNELSQWADIPAQNILIAPNAFEPFHTRSPDLLKNWNLSANHYFLCLSNPKSHKNLRLALDGYAQYRAANGKLPLVMSVGEHELDPVAVNAPKDGVLFAGALPEDAGLALLEHATAILAPSRYEGFGRAPIEAILAGTPCLASSILPHQEGLRNVSALEHRLLPLDSPQEWGKALHDAEKGIIKRPSLETRSNLAKEFSEERLARIMNERYLSALSRG